MSLDDAGMTPGSIMAFFTSKIGKPTPLSKLRPQLGGTLLACVVSLLMTLCPYLVFLWHFTCTTALAFPKVDRDAMKRRIYGFFLRVSIFLFVRAPGLKIHLYGDHKDVFERDENVLYMSNHQSSVDWLVACVLAQRSNCLARIKFIMKQELHWVPIVGYYLKKLGHIYVRRRGFKPDRLINIVGQVKKTNTPIWLGIFPEGTRYNPEDIKAIATSEEMARISNQPVLQHQLTPRPKGSWLLLDNLRTHLSAVYSVTLVYEQPEPKGQRGKPPSASDVLRGTCSSVHVHVKRIPIGDVPKDEADFLPWLQNVFLERDRRMEEYYSSRSFSSWGPVQEEDTSRDMVLVDLAAVVGMVLALLLLPFVRTTYLLTALTATLCGWISLQLDPPF